MIAYYQETDSKVVLALPELAYPLSVSPTNETIGSAFHSSYLSASGESGLFRGAWRVVRQLGNQETTIEARRLLKTIQNTVIAFQQGRFDLANLPPLNAFVTDDGSVYFEWTSRDFRVGFSVELDSNESGWYLVSNAKLGEISASGYLAGIDIKNLIVWLLSFVLSNS